MTRTLRIAVLALVALALTLPIALLTSGILAYALAAGVGFTALVVGMPFVLGSLRPRGESSRAEKRQLVGAAR